MDRTERLSPRRPAPAPARVGGGLYAVRAERSPDRRAAAVALRTLGGIDALIALQGIEDPVERRRRAVKHGRRALDALDELKLGLLSGTLDQGTCCGSRRWPPTSRTVPATTARSVLGEIDLRVAVELAKAGLN